MSRDAMRLNLHYARPTPIRMSRGLSVLWWSGFACATFPYVAPVVAVLVLNSTGFRGGAVVMVVIAMSLLCAVAAVTLALIFMIKAEAAGLPEPYVAVRRRAIGALLLGPFLLLPVVVIVVAVVGLLGGLD